MDTTDHFENRLWRRIATLTIVLFVTISLFTSLSAIYNTLAGASTPLSTAKTILLTILFLWFMLAIFPEEPPF